MAEARSHLPRHQMVWVRRGAWASVLADQNAPDADPLIQSWAEKGWPLVARSRTCEDRDHLLALGVALPPSRGKTRHAFQCDAEHIVEFEKPPLLALAAAVAPAAWLDVISALLLLETDTRCFGSLAWEFWTGLPYLTAESDIDLLWDVTSEAEADRLAMEIARIDRLSPFRIDGEFITPSDAGIQWREWNSGESVVMAKTSEGARLLPRDRVFT